MTVAIVSGEALGLFHSSASQLGTTGTGFGAAGDQLYVNANTGNLVIQRQDQVVKGHGVDASVVRTYNSQGNLSDSIGGQYFNFQQHIVAPELVSTAPKVRVTADGYEQSFTYVSVNHYVSEEGAGAHDTLNYENDHWVYTEGSSGLRETYDNANNGHLLTRTDREGYGQSFEYDGSGRLQYIIDTGKQVTRLSYEDSSTRVSQLENYRVADINNPGTPLSDTSASLIQYAYDDDGRLNRVTVDLTPYKQETSETDSLKNTYTTIYGYDGTSSRISSIHQGVGNSPENAAALFFDYDANERITELRMGEGDEARITRFAYQKDLNDPTGQSDYTEVTDLLDYRREGDTYIPVQTATTRYRYDANGQLTKIEPPADEFGRQQVTSYTYTDHGDVRQIRDGDNHTVRYHYDYDETGVTSNDGLRLWQMDNDGNASRWIYNDNQQVAAEISYQGADVNPLDDTFAPTGAEVTRFIYDETGRLRFTLSPKDSEGNARVQETRYGNMNADTHQRIISSYQYLTTYPVPSAWDVTLDQINTPDSTYRAALEAWVALAPQANSAQITETHLDFRGQVSQVHKTLTQIAIDNTGATNDTIGSETRIQYFIYNEYGRLIQQIDGKTASDSAPNETSETIVSLVGYSSGSGQTLFVYDGLGRLIATALATDNTDDNLATNTLELINELGNTSASIEEDRIDANTHGGRFNSVTHYGVNGDGQQQVTTLYANGLTQIQTYNSAGELLSSLRFDSTQEEILPEDANFGETTYRYDDAGRLRMVIDPEGVRSHTLYDDSGKLIATVDGSGALTEYSYDNSGNQTRTIGYANYLNVTQLNRLATQQDSELVLLSPSLSSIRPSFSPDDRIVHSLYDEANQLAYQIDGEGYVTEYQYDGAGRLTNTIEHGTPYLGYDYVSSDGVAISAPDYDALKAFSQYNYSAEGNYSVSQGAWEQGSRHETDATILTHGISSIADNLSGLVINSTYNAQYLDHGISLDHILADTSQVDTWIQRPIKQLVGKTTWQADFSEAGKLPVYYGFTGIDAQSVGRVSSTEAQPYFTVDNGQLKLTPKNIAYGKDYWWNNSEQVQFNGARQYDTRETFEFSYTFSETDSLSSSKDVLLGMSDENNQTLGFSLEGTEIRLSDEAGTDGLYKFPIVRQQDATYRLHMIRENGIITATVYQVDTNAGSETELAQKVLSVEEQYVWGEGLHSVIELWGTTSNSILIHDIQEIGHAFELPYDVKIDVDNAGDIVPVYGQLHNEITDFSQPQEKANWGFISEGEVNDLGEGGYTIGQAQGTDGLMFAHNQGELQVRSSVTASEGKAVRLVSNQTYHRNAALPLTFRWEIRGGTNSNYSRAFFGFRDEDNNTGGVKLVRNDAFVATGVKGTDVGALPTNRDLDGTQVIELVIIGKRALVYYYPKGSTERQLFDTHEVFDTSNYVTPFIEVWGENNTNYNKEPITVESFQVIGLTEWEPTLAVEDTETIQHIGGRSLQGVYTNDISTIEKLEARLVRSDVLNLVSGKDYKEEWVETYLDIGTYDGRLDIFEGETLSAGEYQIEVRTTTTGDAAPGSTTLLENADGSVYSYTEQYRLQENPYGQGATLEHYFTAQNIEDANYLNLDLYNRIETQVTNIDTGETTVSVTNIDYPEQYSGYVLLDQNAALDTGLYEITIIKQGPGALQSAGDIHETFTSQVGTPQTYTHTIGVPVDDFYNLDNTQAPTLTYWKNDSGRTHSGINQTPVTLILTLNAQTQRYETSLSNLVAGQYGYQVQYAQIDETELATLQGELRGDSSLGNNAQLTSQHSYINHQTAETGEGLHLSNYLTLATRENGDELTNTEKTGITHLSATVRYADSTQVVTQAITDIAGWNLTANESNFQAHDGQLMLSQGQALSAGKYQVDVMATLANGTVVALNSVDFSVSNRLSADGSAIKDTNTARLMWDDQNAEVTTFRYQEENSDKYTTITIHNTDGDAAPEATMTTYQEANNGDWVTREIGPKITGGLTGVERLSIDGLTSTVVSREGLEPYQNTGLRQFATEEVFDTQTIEGLVDTDANITSIHLPLFTYTEDFSHGAPTYDGVTDANTSLEGDGVLLTGTRDGQWHSITDRKSMLANQPQIGSEATAEFSIDSGSLQYEGFVGLQVSDTSVFGLKVEKGGVLSMIQGDIESPLYSEVVNGISWDRDQDYTVRVQITQWGSGVIEITNALGETTTVNHGVISSSIKARVTAGIKTTSESFGDGLRIKQVSKTGYHHDSDTSIMLNHYKFNVRELGETNWHEIAYAGGASFNEYKFTIPHSVNGVEADTEYEFALVDLDNMYALDQELIQYEEEVGYGRFSTKAGDNKPITFTLKQSEGTVVEREGISFQSDIPETSWGDVESVYVEVFEKRDDESFNRNYLIGSEVTRASLDPDYSGYMNLPTGLGYDFGFYDIKATYRYSSGETSSSNFANVHLSEQYPQAVQSLVFQVPEKAADTTISVLARPVGSEEAYQAFDVIENAGVYQANISGSMNSEWEYIIVEKLGDTVKTASIGTLTLGKQTGIVLNDVFSPTELYSADGADYVANVEITLVNGEEVIVINNNLVEVMNYDGSLYINHDLALANGIYTISAKKIYSTGAIENVMFGENNTTSIQYQVGSTELSSPNTKDALEIDDTYSFTFTDPTDETQKISLELSKAIDRNSITLSNLNDSRYAYGIEYSDAAGNLYGQTDSSFMVSHLATPTAADLQRFYGFSEDVEIEAKSGKQTVVRDAEITQGYEAGVSYVEAVGVDIAKTGELTVKDHRTSGVLTYSDTYLWESGDNATFEVNKPNYNLDLSGAGFDLTPNYTETGVGIGPGDITQTFGEGFENKIIHYFFASRSSGFSLENMNDTFDTDSGSLNWWWNDSTWTGGTQDISLFKMGLFRANIDGNSVGGRKGMNNGGINKEGNLIWWQDVPATWAGLVDAMEYTGEIGGPLTYTSSNITAVPQFDIKKA